MEFLLAEIVEAIRSGLWIAFTLPLIIGISYLSLEATITHQPNAAAATGLIVDAVIPWWLGIVQFLAGISVIGGFLAFAFLYAVRYS